MAMKRKNNTIYFGCLDIQVGDKCRVLWCGTAPERYKGKIVTINQIARGTFSDEEIYYVWDSQDKVFYAFGYDEIRKVNN